jgi:hypothetical protein
MITPLLFNIQYLTFNIFAMEVQEVDVFIEKNGQVRVEVQGVKGMACLDLTKGIEDALGGQVDDREMRPEAYEAADVVVEERQRQQVR